MTDELEIIRTRHEEAEKIYAPIGKRAASHTDRATLLRAVDRLSAEMAKERERRVEVEGALIDLNTAIDKMWNDTEGRVVSERHALDITHAQRAAAATLTKDTP